MPSTIRLKKNSASSRSSLGLYYPGIGGCRIEDVVQVTAAAPKMLSRYHYTIGNSDDSQPALDELSS